MSENIAPKKVEYNGWKLFDKVIICARPWQRWEGNKYITDDLYQGYIVEPGNKKQLESAKHWAKCTLYGPYNWDRREYEWKKECEGEIFEFDNSGFTLELLNSAEGSSQGGKLSFWNCKISKDDKTFVIGIAADLLLDVLKSHTVINGKVQGALMFARCKGGVGMLSTDMEAYKEAIADMQTKAKMSKGKTSKHVVGKVYGTTTLANIYVGDFYIWYEPIYKEVRGCYAWSNSSKELIGFKKLSEPKVVKYFPSYQEGKNKLSEYGRLSTWNLEEKLPKRVELAIEINLDISKEQLVTNWLNDSIVDPYNKYLEAINKGYRQKFNLYAREEYIGISANQNSYDLPKDIVKILNAVGYSIIE